MQTRAKKKALMLKLGQATCVFLKITESTGF